MSQEIAEIFKPQTSFEGVDNLEKLAKIFTDLYRIEIFKPGLDLILTNLKYDQISFEVKIVKGWDTNIGCFLTEQKEYYDPLKGGFLRINKPKIILRNFSHNLLAHEMAHALEFESGINFGQDFRTAVGLDMKDRLADSLPLRGEIERIMVNGVKSYPIYQILSELFARYFELLSLSRNVQAFGDFTTDQVMDFFANTTKFLTEIFNPAIKAKIDSNIASQTAIIAKKVQIEGASHKFSEKIDPFKKKNTSSWSSNLRSNSMWHKSWQNNIEDN